MQPSDRPHPAQGLEVEEVKDGLVVHDSDRNRVHYLNASAAVVFTLCDGAREREGIIEATTKIFGPSLSRREVEACIAQLEDEQVLRSVD